MAIDYNRMLEPLIEAYASGHLEVTIGTQTVKFGSAGDLLSRIRWIKGQIAQEEEGVSLSSGYSVQAVSGNGIRRDA